MIEKIDIKIDVWWKAVLLIGILGCIGSVIFEIKFIQSKYLFGFSLGLIVVGIAQWMAWKTISQILPKGILSTKIIKHNALSLIILIIGVGLVCLFGFLIIKGLI